MHILKELSLGLIFVLSLSTYAQQNESLEFGPIMYSHYEFSQLTTEQQVAYIKMLREVLRAAEADVTNRGDKFETAFNKMRIPYWGALFESVEAQTQRKAGTPCVYAGGFSSYAADNTKSCINNRKCESGKRQIQCNPLLYGDNLCVSAGDGATARCDRAKRSISDEDLAKALSQADKRSEWDSFKTQFDNFCVGVFKSRKDINYQSCKRIETRMNRLSALIALTPPAQPQPVNPPQIEPQLLKSQMTEVKCKPGQRFNCYSCDAKENQPDFYSVREPAEGRHLPQTSKYGQLIRAMEGVCGVANKSDSGPNAVSAKSVDSMVRRFGLCDESEYGDYRKYKDAEQQKIIEAAVAGNRDIHQKLSGGLWYNPPYSDAFQDYFGINTKDARQVFCKGANNSEAIAILNGQPDSTILYGGAMSAADLNDLLKDDKPVTSLPTGFNQDGLGRADGDPLAALNKYKFAKLKRMALAKCLEANLADAERRKVTRVNRVEKRCYVSYRNVKAEDMEANLVDMIEKEGSTCVTVKDEKGQDKPFARCDSFNAEKSVVNCAPAELPKGQPVTLAKLVCQSEARLQGEKRITYPHSEGESR